MRWALLAAVVAVLLATAIVAVRIWRGIAAIAARVGAYGDLPVVAALRTAEVDGARIQAAVAAVDPLLTRAQIALATIRRGPLPPELFAAFARVRAEFGAFTTARR